VPATLSFEGKEYPQVAVRYKGFYDGLVSCFIEGTRICKKLSVRLSFNEYDEHGRFYGLKRLTWFYNMMGTIPVAYDVPDPGAMKAALRTIREGGVVGIFPEGQRMRDGNLGEGKAGAAMIAARSGAPVVPAAIIGAHRVMPVGSAFPRPYRIRVVFGEPIRFPPHEGRRPPREQLDAFADRIMQSIADLMTPEEAAEDAPSGTRRSSAP
jgi:1-acyl-sn-glycerol-3-phosphate acyltransferase